MKHLLTKQILSAVFALTAVQLYAQAPFIQSYLPFPVTQDQVEVVKMHQCVNSDLLLGWNQNSGFAFTSYGVITRTNASGIPLWSSMINDGDTTTNIFIRSVGENSDGSIWVMGQVEALFPVYYRNYFMAELSANGTLNWTKFYDVTNTYIIGWPGCHKMYDGGYMIRISFDTHIQLLRTDSAGNLRWGKLYSTDTTGAKFRGLGLPTPDSNYVIIGKNGDYLSYIKIDTAGNVLSSYKMLGWWNPGDGVLGSICMLPDNSIMVSGRSDFDPFLMKLDPQGNVLWIKTYTSTTINTDVLFYIMTASDGTIYATGSRDAPINLSSLGQMFHFDTSGNVLQAAACMDSSLAPGSMSVSMLGNSDELFILETSPTQGPAVSLYKIGTVLGAACYMKDITTMVANHTPSPPQPGISTGVDGWSRNGDLTVSTFLLTYTLECNATGINEPATGEPATLFPNPVHTGGVVTFTAANTTAWQITDAAGRLVLKGQTAGGTVEISLSELSSGVYVFTSFNENGQLEIRQKLIKAF